MGLVDRYPPHGRKPAKEEDGVQWSRIRAPPVSTPAHDLHASDCLETLRPGDHFEIQWRKNKDFPYGTKRSFSLLSVGSVVRWLMRCVTTGWWYGVVGHQASCNANEHLCRCHEDGKDSQPVTLLTFGIIVGSNTCGQDKLYYSYYK